jgi:hypothetical protein
VVIKDGAAREAPLAAVLFDQFARVAAGRQHRIKRAAREWLATT